MRTVVTGGAGFIGSHLCDFLLEQGHEVICLDNLLTGDISNITHLAGNERFTFIKHDVTEYIYIEGGVDYVLHLASPASPIDYLELPIHTLKVGSLGTHKAVGLAKAKGATFLLASTSEVYGDPLVHPQSEDYWGNVNPVGPRAVYDEAKRFAETLTMAYHHLHGLDTKIVRIFNTFGPRMRLHDGRVIPSFISQALRGEEVTIFGDGLQTRSFCYISDLVEGLYALLTSNENNPLNLGSTEEITILALVKEILELTGSSSKTVHLEKRPGDPSVRRPDTTKARNLLNWQPKVSRREGLKRTIEYFREALAQKARK